MFRYKDLRPGQIGLRAWLEWKLSLAELYISTDIIDFYNSREDAKRPLGGHIPPYNGITVAFPAANYYEIGKDTGVISDPTGEVDVLTKWLPEDLKEDISSRTKLIAPVIVYSFSINTSGLVAYETDIQITEGSLEEKSELVLATAFGF